MKLNKSTTVLLNVVLILLVAIMLKNLLSFPKTLFAGGSPQYKVVKDLSNNPETRLEKTLNNMAKEGWRFHSLYPTSTWLLVFEK